MSRIIVWTAVLAIGFGLMMLWERAGSKSGASLAMETPELPYTGWAIGLVMGLALAWVVRIEWSAIPERLAAWVRAQRRRVAWAVLGSVCIAILLYF